VLGLHVEQWSYAVAGNMAKYMCRCLANQKQQRKKKAVNAEK